MTAFQRQITLLLGDWLLFYLSLALAISIRQFEFVPMEFLLSHFVTFSGLFPFWLAAFYAMELYEIKTIYKLIPLIENSIMALFVNLSLSLGYFYLFSVSLGITPKTNLLLTVFLSIGASVLLRRFFVYMIWSRMPALRVAFWGDNPIFARMTRDLNDNELLGYTPVSKQSMEDFDSSISLDEYWRQGDRGVLKLRNFLDLVVVDSEQVETEPIKGQSLLAVAIMEELPIRTHLNFYEELYLQIPPEYAAKSHWLLSNVLHQRNRGTLLIKRGFDIIVSAAGLLLLSPLLLLITALIRIIDGGTPFYTQWRVGYHGKEFMIWKFRTMIPEAEKLGPLVETTAQDQRITWLGAALRRFRLDEFPQLWNVLKGDMSLIGPRPEWNEEVRILEKRVPHYHLRHLVKPGMSGWAQVNFRATASAADSLEKLHYDLYYIKNLSFALDIGILLKTAKRVFMKESKFTKLATLTALLAILGPSACAPRSARKDTFARFPIGIYDVENPELLSRLSQDGLDTFIPTTDDPDRLDLLAKKARRLNMRMILPPGGLIEGPTARAKKWPVAAWYLMDEPEVHKVPPSELAEKSRTILAWDPDRPQVLVIGSGSAAASFGAIADILMLDWYPVPHLLLDSVAEEIEKAMAAIPREKPFWFVVQAFDWKEFPQHNSSKPRIGRFPKFEEIRFMSYMAVVRGARGLFFFTMRKQEKNLLDFPELWQAVSRVTREFKSLQPILENGRLAPLPFPADPDGPQARAWRYRGRDYLVILNRKKNVLQKIPDELLREDWRPLFENRRDPRDLLTKIEPAWYLRPYQVLVLESALKRSVAKSW